MIFKGFRLGMAVGAFCIGYAYMLAIASWASEQIVKMVKNDEEKETDEEK